MLETGEQCQAWSFPKGKRVLLCPILTQSWSRPVPELQRTGRPNRSSHDGQGSEIPERDLILHFWLFLTGFTKFYERHGSARVNIPFSRAASPEGISRSPFQIEL